MEYPLGKSVNLCPITNQQVLNMANSHNTTTGTIAANQQLTWVMCKALSIVNEYNLPVHSLHEGLYNSQKQNPNLGEAIPVPSQALLNNIPER